jgi:release factor glutamine methyltransferase
MKALNKLKEATKFLEESGLEDAVREAETIIVHCLETDRTALLRDNPVITKSVIEKIDEFLERRSKREPLQYILGYVDFLGMKMKVGKGVLIPRPETELLAEEAIKTVRSQQSNQPLLISNPPSPPFSKGGMGGFEKGGQREGNEDSSGIANSSLSILDLCTGSGCLALALAKEFPQSHVYGTDISEAAIEYARKNAEINGIKNVTFLKGSLFEPLRELFTVHHSLLTFDLIVSNPPYIKEGDIRTLQPEIKNWEPVEALNGGEDGLDYYRLIISEARNYLKDSGCIMLELGINEADEVRELAKHAGFKDISFRKDYAGIERIIVAKGFEGSRVQGFES